jgi:hypothetical protein
MSSLKEQWTLLRDKSEKVETFFVDFFGRTDFGFRERRCLCGGGVTTQRHTRGSLHHVELEI